MTIEVLALDALGHVAYVDPIHGCGLVVRPNPDGDVWLGNESVFWSAWSVAVRRLAEFGWDILADDFDEPVIEGVTADGCEVVALYGLDPVLAQPMIEELAVACSDLRRIAQVVADSPLT
jgi:hypothetical protein